MESEFEEYYTQCGEIYLTIKGNIVLHCILCEDIYKSFEEYANHTKIHYQDWVKEQAEIDIAENIKSKVEIDKNNKEIDYAEASMSCSTDEVEPNISLENVTIKKEVKPKECFDDSNVKNEKNTEKLSPLKVSRPLKNLAKPRKYKCTHCSYACTDSSNLSKHIKRHSLEKTYICEECSKAFHTRMELKTHLRTHTGEKPFLCAECGLSFSTSSWLRMHQKRHFGKKDFKCNQCNFSCYNKQHLRRHIAIHSDERNFKCLQCVASFKSQVGLWNHMKIHENKKEYACKICDSKFNQLAGLYSHMKTSHTALS